MFLLDTNVVSQAAPTKAAASPGLIAWMRANSDRLYISVVTASEVEAGMAKAERSGAGRKAAILREWWSELEAYYGERLIPFDLRAAREAGRIADRARAFAPEYQDVAIAATAQVHGLTVVTFNERHFRTLGVAYLNPTLLPL